MIKEFAVDPQLFSSYVNFDRFYDMFGFDKGRIIVAFPKKWQRKVFDSRNNDWKSHQSKQLELWLTKKSKYFLVDCRNIDIQSNSTSTWLEHALLANEKYQLFDTIMATSNNYKLRMLCPFSDDSTINFREHELFISSGGRFTIKRNYDGFKKACCVVVKHAKQIILIDRFFGHNKDWMTIIKVIFDSMPTTSSTIPCIIIPSEFNQKIESNLKQGLSKVVPIGKELKIVFVEPNDNHNRYIVTDRCALDFSAGLRESVGETDDVSITAFDRHEELLEKYSENSMNPDIVTGTFSIQN